MFDFTVTTRSLVIGPFILFYFILEEACIIISSYFHQLATLGIVDIFLGNLDRKWRSKCSLNDFLWVIFLNVWHVKFHNAEECNMRRVEGQISRGPAEFPLSIWI